MSGVPYIFLSMPWTAVSDFSYSLDISKPVLIEVFPFVNETFVKETHFFLLME